MNAAHQDHHSTVWGGNICVLNSACVYVDSIAWSWSTQLTNIIPPSAICDKKLLLAAQTQLDADQKKSKNG